MTVYIKPSTARGEITAPPSKSVLHRALICAALSGGSNVFNIAESDDISATLGALKALGADVKKTVGGVHLCGLSPDTLKGAEINAQESGSTLRFLIPLVMLSGKKTVFTGAKRLFDRDLSVYSEIADNQDILFKKSENSLTVCGKLKGGQFNICGDISSQFVSGLMFALPLLNEDSFISFSTQPESKPYIDITVSVLSFFGISIEETPKGYFIKGNQQYKPCDYTAEGDYSNAAFLDAFNLLGGNVTVNGLLKGTAQGDRVYKEIFGEIASGGVFVLSDCPDLAPILFCLAAEFSGAHFTGTARLKIKESDRAAAMKEELLKFGAEISVSDNEVLVKKTVLHTPLQKLCSHNDHRIVMALSVLASKYGGEIEGAEAVNKSYPEFFKDIRKLGIEVKTDENK